MLKIYKIKLKIETPALVELLNSKEKEGISIG